MGFGPIRLTGLTVQTNTWLSQTSCPHASSGGPSLPRVSKQAIRDSVGHPPTARTAMFSLISSQKEEIVSWT